MPQPQLRPHPAQALGIRFSFSLGFFGGGEETPGANAGRGCSSHSNWRSQWEVAGPAAPAARGRGGNLANLPRQGVAARGGAEPGRGRGRREPEAEAGPRARGAACRRACAGPRGCASRSRDCERCFPAALGGRDGERSPRDGDCDVPARRGAGAPAGPGAGAGGEPAGSRKAGAEVSAGTWLGAPLLGERLGAAVRAVGGGGRALTPAVPGGGGGR